MTEHTRKNRIPRLNETLMIRTNDRIFYQTWLLPPPANSYWLIAEFDAKRELAFGYVKINNIKGTIVSSEWELIDIRELRHTGAMKLMNWKPCPFPRAVELVEHMLRQWKLGDQYSTRIDFDLVGLEKETVQR